MRNKAHFPVLILLLMAMSLACVLPTATAPTSTPAPTNAAAEPVLSLEEQAATSAASGTLQITATEQQLTDLMVEKTAGITGFPITEPVIELRNGLFTLRGKVTVSGLNSEAKIDLKPQLTAGKLGFEATSASIGPLPVPDSILSQITDQINQYLAELLKSEYGDYEVDSVDISDGRITITGKPLP